MKRLSFVMIALIVMSLIVYFTWCGQEIAYPPAGLSTVVLDSTQELSFNWVEVYPFDEAYKGFVMNDGTYARGTIYLFADAKKTFPWSTSDNTYTSQRAYRFDVGGNDSAGTFARAVIVEESRQSNSGLSRAIVRIEKNSQGRLERVLYVNISKTWSGYCNVREMKQYISRP